jgi:hypothetical protein
VLREVKEKGMKRDGRLSVVFVLCLTLFTVSVFADEQTMNLQSFIVEDFDNPDKNPWLLQGSKFSSQVKTEQGTDVYPKLAFRELMAGGIVQEAA